MSGKLTILLLLLLSASPAFAKDWAVTVGGTDSGGYGYGNTDVLAFAPSSLTIDAGDTITFTNVGGTHNVASDTPGLFRCANGCDGAGGNGTPAAGWTSTVTFSTPGTFGFHCEVHGTMGMRGSVTVNAVAPTFAITPGLTGSWYNPTQSGQGFNIEVLPNNTLVAFWYVFDGSGNNLWLSGIGTYSGDTGTLNMVQTTGGLFPPNFDPTKITRTPWGTLSFTFTDCSTATASWVPTNQATFPSGSLAIKRLTSVNGLACP